MEETTCLFRVMRLASALNRSLDLLCAQYEITNAQRERWNELNALSKRYSVQERKTLSSLLKRLLLELDPA
jgi:hypothetical protein